MGDYLVLVVQINHFKFGVILKFSVLLQLAAATCNIARETHLQKISKIFYIFTCVYVMFIDNSL